MHMRERSDFAEFWIRLLSLMMVAPALWPLFPESLNRTVQTPFGFRREAIALVAVGVFAVYFAVSVRRVGARWALARSAYLLASLFALAVILGFIMQSSGNGYFTSRALSEGLIVLLGVHIVAMALRWTAGDAISDRPRWLRIADGTLLGATLLLIGFWVFAALQLHYVAGMLIAFAAGCYLTCIVMLGLPAAAGVSRTAPRPVVRMGTLHFGRTREDVTRRPVTR